MSIPDADTIHIGLVVDPYYGRWFATQTATWALDLTGELLAALGAEPTLVVDGVTQPVPRPLPDRLAATVPAGAGHHAVVLRRRQAAS